MGGALTSSRKRGDDDYTLNFTFPSSHNRIQTHVSKKQKTSSAMDQSSEQPSSLSSPAWRISQYPEPVKKISREVHAPCRGLKPGIWARFFTTRGGQNKALDDEVGEVLSFKYDKAKKCAIESLQYYKKDKELVIDVDEEPDKDEASVTEVIDVDKETDKDDVSESLSIGNVEFVEDVREEGPIVSSSRNVNSDVDDAGKMLDLLSLDLHADVLELPVHKKLLETAERRNHKLSSLSYQIELSEKRRKSFQLFHAEKITGEKNIFQGVLHEAFIPLTKEEEAEVSQAFSKSNRRKVLVTHENSNIEITGEVLQCLRPGKWLNDEVINLYLELLKEREEREPKFFLKCHFFNTFFYKKLISGRSGYDFKLVRRWTTQKKLGYCLFECDKIFVPIHKEAHWCLAVINKKDEKFQYLDSLGGIDTQVLEVLAMYFVDEVKDKNGENIDIDSWTQEYVEDLPEQRNGWDCGMFMIKYVDFYSRGLGLRFNQEHMPYFRLRTAKEILRLKAE